MILAENKDINVTDARGNFLARYDWNGRLIKKKGKRWQGPGDILAPGDLNLLGMKSFEEDLKV